MNTEHRNTPAFAISKFTTPLFYADEKLRFSYDFAGATHFVNVPEQGYYSKEGKKYTDIVKVCSTDISFPMREKDAKIFIDTQKQVGDNYTIESI